MNLDELRRAGITPASELTVSAHFIVGFGGLREDLPQSANRLLNEFLPTYAESRRTWPLWTYERQPPHFGNAPMVRSSTWFGIDSWPDRLAFSGLRLLGAAEETLKDKAGAFYLELFEWYPRDSLALFLPIEEKAHDFPPYPKDEFFYRLTYFERAAVAAVIMQTAREVPTSMEDVVRAPIEETEYPDPDATLLIDDADKEELVAAVGAALTERGVLADLIRYRREASRSRKSRQDSADQRQRRAESGSSQVSEVFRRMGLLSTQGGPRTALDDSVLLDLYNEALGIVDELRKWNLNERILDLLLDVIREDPRMDLTPMDEAQLHRGTVPRWLQAEAVHCRFPFLLPTEIDQVTRQFEEGATLKAAARHLAMNRLPGFDPEAPGEDEGFEVLLSKARREPPAR